MKFQDIIKKKIEIAEKRVLELNKAGDLRNLPDAEKYQISGFYEEKSKNRLRTAKIIYNASKKSDENGENYKDYAEVVSAAYYSMYYIVHAFLALNYKRKLRDGLRGVHSITENIILYYLVKTSEFHSFLTSGLIVSWNSDSAQEPHEVWQIHATHLWWVVLDTKKLAEHLYAEYLKTFETTAQIQKLSLDDFQEKSYRYAEQYDKSRTAREIFTYNTTPNVEEYHARQAINTAEEFINTIRQVMI